MWNLIADDCKVACKLCIFEQEIALFELEIAHGADIMMLMLEIE